MTLNWTIFLLRNVETDPGSGELTSCLIKRSREDLCCFLQVASDCGTPQFKQEAAQDGRRATGQIIFHEHTHLPSSPWAGFSLPHPALRSVGPDSRGLYHPGLLASCFPGGFSKKENTAGGPRMGRERGWVLSLSWVSSSGCVPPSLQFPLGSHPSRLQLPVGSYFHTWLPSWAPSALACYGFPLVAGHLTILGLFPQPGPHLNQESFHEKHLRGLVSCLLADPDLLIACSNQPYLAGARPGILNGAALWHFRYPRGHDSCGLMLIRCYSVYVCVARTWWALKLTSKMQVFYSRFQSQEILERPISIMHGLVLHKSSEISYILVICNLRSEEWGFTLTTSWVYRIIPDAQCF